MDELELISIQIGKPFPLFSPIKEDGAFLEASEHSQGYYLCVSLLNMHQSEIDAFRNPARIRIVENIDGMILPLIRFGNTEMIFELSFDPTLYDDARALQFVEENNILSIFAVERNGNIVKVIRQANLPLKFIQYCKESWSKAFLEVNYSERYKKWYQELQMKYSTKGLWNRGVDVGKLGEVYDLDEIHYNHKRQ